VWWKPERHINLGDAPAFIEWYWSYSWWQVFCLTSILIYGMMFGLQWAWTGKFELSAWWAFNIGDAFALPALAAFTRLAIGDGSGSSHWYNGQIWFTWWTIFGIAATIANALNDRKMQGSWERVIAYAFAPWHIIIIPVFVALFLSVTGVAVAECRSLIIWVGVLMTFGLYAGTLLRDGQFKAMLIRTGQPIPGWR
jgi:hypothetical protein